MFPERQIQQIRPGKATELEALDQKINTIEGRLGFPTKRRFRCYIGGLPNSTLVIGREWEGLAVMGTEYMKIFADSEWEKQ